MLRQLYAEIWYVWKKSGEKCRSLNSKIQLHKGFEPIEQKLFSLSPLLWPWLGHKIVPNPRCFNGPFCLLVVHVGMYIQSKFRFSGWLVMYLVLWNVKDFLYYFHLILHSSLVVTQPAFSIEQKLFHWYTKLNIN